VHSHWTPREFKSKTTLNKLDNRVLVVVDSEALPLELRTELFTADRAQTIQSPMAMRIEEEIAGFLNEWPALRDANNELIREAITGVSNDRSTITIARQIARALKAKGFSLGHQGSSRGGSNSRVPSPTPLRDLNDDPTSFEGPATVQAPVGQVKGIPFRLNATDNFLGGTGRGELLVSTDHPDISPNDITIGELRSGRVRVSLAVADNAELGSFTLSATIPEWIRSSGGLGPRFEWVTELEVVAEGRESPPRSGPGTRLGKQGVGEGALVALVWKSDKDDGLEEWTPDTVGDVLLVEGKDLAEEHDEYAELAETDISVPTILLNRTYAPLKKYIQARSVEGTERSKDEAYDRYAVGTGVALMILDQHTQTAREAEDPSSEKDLAVGKRAAARGVLSVLPAYDLLAREMAD
jgi:hypothetical protein